MLNDGDSSWSVSWIGLWSGGVLIGRMSIDESE